MRRLLPCALLALAPLACAETPGPPTGGTDAATRVLLTDGPFPYDLVDRVDLYIVGIWAATSADTTAGQEWMPIAMPARRFNLLDYQNGATVEVGGSDLPFHQWAAVRLVINTDSSGITLADGRAAGVEWGTAGEITLHALVEQPLVTWAEEEGDIVIDIDVGRSFATPDELARSASVDFYFLPWLRAVNARATGTIRGTIRDVAGPRADASVAAYRVLGDEGPVVLAATGRSDAAGEYVLAYLNAGAYVLEARAAGAGPSARAASGVVTILMGDERTVDLTLGADTAGGGSGYPDLLIWGPTLVALDDTVVFHAAAFDADGDSVPAPAVVWTTVNPAVASVHGAGAVVDVAGEGVGSTRLVGWWNGLGDSVTVTVVTSTDTTGGGGGDSTVASITMQPASQTAAVGDSLGFYADLRNAQGQAITGPAVAWTVSDSSVVVEQGVFGQSLILRAVGSGTATVTATSQGKSSSGTVFVN